MHQNRSRYSFAEYQAKLRNGYKNLGIVCQHHETGDCIIFRPIPNCPWLPESRKKYFGKIKNRLEGLPSDHKYTFCTLTYGTRFYTPKKAASLVKHHIDLFFKRLYYRKNKPEYFYVIELTDNLMVHVHLIFDRYIHWRKIRKSWYAVTRNSVTDIRHLPGKQAFYYAIKYLTQCKKQSKGKWQFIFHNIDRVWSASRHFWGCGSAFLSSYEYWFTVSGKLDQIKEIFFSDTGDLLKTELSQEHSLYLYCDAHESELILHEFKHQLPKIKEKYNIPEREIYFPFYTKNIYLQS